MTCSMTTSNNKETQKMQNYLRNRQYDLREAWNYYTKTNKKQNVSKERDKMKTLRALATTFRGGTTLQKMSKDHKARRSDDKDMSNSKILQKVTKSHKMTIKTI